MFSRIPELAARIIQYTLVVAMLSFTLLCFVPAESLPEWLAGDFQPKQGLTLQGEPFHAAQQANPSITSWLWRAVTLVPLFLLVFGHEAWRRICPISGWMQIPRRLGTQLRQKLFNRRSGKIDRPVYTVASGSWLERNAWYPPFVILVIGVALRMTLYNSDAFMLGVFLVALLVAAMLTGLLTGGKTWCHYFCPLSPVQRIYSEPGGLLESQAHLDDASVTKSTCRSLDGKSACIGCKVNCPDIDLEKHYWEDIQNKSRKHVYYGYFGLVIGFFLYYRLYAGNWEFLLSGGWAVEKLCYACTNPGFYDMGFLSAIPRIIAAPLTLLACILGSIGFWTAVEKLALKTSHKTGHTLGGDRLQHELFVFITFLTIIIFYGFGVEMNLANNPVLKNFCHVAVMFLATIWMLTSIRRSHRLYQREAISSSLQRQLYKYEHELKDVLDENQIEHLTPDETFVLARTLPKFLNQARFDLYKGVLKETIDSGQTDSTGSLKTLRDLRKQLDISDTEHAQILDTLGYSENALLQPGRAISHEQRMRLKGYSEGLRSLLSLWSKVNPYPIKQALEDEEIATAISSLRLNFNITSEEHEHVLSELLSTESQIEAECLNDLQLLYKQAFTVYICRTALSANPYAPSILRGILPRIASICERLLHNAQGLEHAADRKALCHSILSLCGQDVLSTAALKEKCNRYLAESDSDSESPNPSLNLNYRTFADEDSSPEKLLISLTHDSDPVLAAQSLAALITDSPDEGQKRAIEILDTLANDHDQQWLANTARHFLGKPWRAESSGLTLICKSQGEIIKQQSFSNERITIGSADVADFHCAHPAIITKHLLITVGKNSVSCEILATVSHVTLNDAPVESDTLELKSGDILTLGSGKSAISFQFEFAEMFGEGWVAEPMAMVDCLRYLSQFDIFSGMSIDSLAELAGGISPRLYNKGSLLCVEGDATTDIIAVCNGQANVTVNHAGEQQQVVGKITSGDVIGELAFLTGGVRTASICVTSSQCLVLVIPATTISSLVNSDIKATKSLLQTVGERLHRLLSNR